MTDFLLMSLWMIAIAVVVNLVMEKAWARIAQFPTRNERGTLDMTAPPPKHRR